MSSATLPNLERATGPVPFLDLARIHEPLADEFERAWHEVVDASAFVGGPHVEGFESAFAQYTGTQRAIGVANGTDALQVTLRAMEIGPGDEVILPANTFVATAEAVALVGATPKVVDVDDATLLMQPEALEGAITPRTAAVIVVHLYGQVADMPAIGAVADRHGIRVIEDAAQAHGARFDGRPAGSFGDAGCFSFYPGKNLGALGDGGAVVTDDEQLAERIWSIAAHGRSATSRYHHPNLGTNSRLDGLQAALLSIKLPHLDAWNRQRRAIDARYRDELAGHACRFIEQYPQGEAVHHLEVVRVPERDEVRRRLDERGIATGIHYPVPVHELEPFRDAADGAKPITERAKDELLSLPMFPGMSDDEVDRVVHALVEVLDEVAS